MENMMNNPWCKSDVKSGGSHVSFAGFNRTARKTILRWLRGTNVNRRGDSCPRPLVHLTKSDGGDEFRFKARYHQYIEMN
ncbi:hypothetical protein YC2023_000950 [Brassica napus]